MFSLLKDSIAEYGMVMPNHALTHLISIATSRRLRSQLRIAGTACRRTASARSAKNYVYEDAVALAPVTAAMRSCIWRVRGGTMPTIRSMTMSCAR